MTKPALMRSQPGSGVSLPPPSKPRNAPKGRPKIGFRRLALLAVASTVAMGQTRRADDLPDHPLQGPSGITALSGQVLDTKGNPLSSVELSVGTSHTRSDDAGRFLLTYVVPGRTVLQIDGRHAGPSKGDYGYYEASVEAVAARTTVLPFKSWLPLIDHTHDVEITAPTASAVVVTTPDIPDFELRIPAGVVIRDADGKSVRRLGITAMPRDRTPVPLPPDLDVPVFYTIQPGASCLYDAKGGVGSATLAFPNFGHELPKARAVLWRYEPDARGWASYGYGTVGRDGRQVVPDPGAVLTDFDSGQCDPETRTRQPPLERPDMRPRKAK